MKLVLPTGGLAVAHDGTDAHLRAWTVEDAPLLVKAWNDPEIARFNPVPQDRSVDHAARWIEGCDRRLESGVALDLAIVQSAVVGEVGLSSFDSRRRAALIGFWLLEDARGAGLAAAAVSALAQWAVELGLLNLVAQCAHDNTASHRVVERAGFRHVDEDAQFQLWMWSASS